MAQFDVYRNPSPRSSRRAPYLLEVQSNLLDAVTTCVVIPLVTPESFIPAKVLNPAVGVLGEHYLLCTAEITAVLRTALGKPVCSVAGQRSEIITAIDRLLL